MSHYKYFKLQSDYKVLIAELFFFFQSFVYRLYMRVAERVADCFDRHILTIYEVHICVWGKKCYILVEKIVLDSMFPYLC